MADKAAIQRVQVPPCQLPVEQKGSGEVLPQLKQRTDDVQQTQEQAKRNQDVYLTWDHMDIYFATSMRKRWEYEDLFDFVHELMTHPDLAALKLRYVDPTQSFTDNRVNKGLVESLMLKRAECTVYSVQDTDTLGKDSEVAATLAQGKPVIAYIPEISPGQRAQDLVREDPVTLQERLRFLMHADEVFAASLSPQEFGFVHNFSPLRDFEQTRLWRSIPDVARIKQLREDHGEAINQLCQILALSEASIR